MFSRLVSKINSSKNIVLSTHRSPDGDGLGAEVAIANALKSLDKNVRLIHVDSPDSKYEFLYKRDKISIFPDVSVPQDTDLVIITDTNDGRMLPQLFEDIITKKISFAFFDHHPPLVDAPNIGDLSVIDTSAASTGEMAFYLIQKLGVPLNEKISEALYTSICFDTQLFRYIKSSASSHALAAKIVPYIEDPEFIHEQLFGNLSVNKYRFMASCISKIDFYFNNSVALLVISQKDLEQFDMRDEDTRDVIDNLLSISSVQIAALVFEQIDGLTKLSFRSRRKIPILSLAESFGGGGHPYAAGAYSTKPKKEIIEWILQSLESLI